jgi:hypothetical protein
MGEVASLKFELEKTVDSLDIHWSGYNDSIGKFI